MAEFHSRVPFEKSARFSGNSNIDISEVTRQAYLQSGERNKDEGGFLKRGASAGTGNAWNPSNWSWRKRILAGVVVLVIILAAVLGGVLGSRAAKANSYPAYSKLNYSPKDQFQGTTFFNNFDYFEGYDPTSGWVHYDPLPAATQSNLTFAGAQNAIIRVDNKDPNATTGRHSVRITSKNQYETGLFVFDIAHSPYGCGTWPSIWLVDPSNWPYHGEIDVLETVNNGTSGNQMTLHTSEGCSMQGVKRMETGTIDGTSCVNSTDDNAGCAVKGSPDTYGPLFNQNGGGVYAMELRSDGIRTWFFPRDNIPADVTAAQSPDPSSWGTALADFPNTDCDISSHFQNLSIVVDIDLCGTWAGTTSIYNDQDHCPSNCTDFVSYNPSAFDDAYWSINSFKVYQA